jgi:thiamine transport system substrate-binding protein
MEKELIEMRRALLLMTLILVAVACAQDEPVTPETLTLIAHDSFAGGVDDDTFAGFTASTGIEVEVIAGGDAGSMVNQLVLTKDNPLADVAFGIDDTFLSRAVDEGVFTEHDSPLLEDTVDGVHSTTALVTSIDYGDVCINYDKEWFADSGLAVPSTLEELRDPTYAELLTVEHPATSSPGLAFMLATITEYELHGWLDFWEDLHAGGTRIAPDWDTAYYGEFTRYGGESPMVVSYASSPPAEVIFAEEPVNEAPTGVIEAGCYRQIEYAGVLDGTLYPDAAGHLIDYMLSVEFQETIPLTWFVFPANRDAELPEVFTENTTVPENPVRFAYEGMADREEWIAQWVSVMEG